MGCCAGSVRQWAAGRSPQVECWLLLAGRLGDLDLLHLAPLQAATAASSPTVAVSACSSTVRLRRRGTPTSAMVATATATAPTATAARMPSANAAGDR